MDTESLTYHELADRMGVKLDSARKTVRRKRWQKVTGNDGTLRILVPVEALPLPTGRPPDSPKDSQRELEIMIDGLRALLQAETWRAETAEQDRDRWHAMACRPWWRRLAG